MQENVHRATHRYSHRHTLQGTAYLRSGHGVFQRCNLVDLSETGVGIASSNALGEAPTQIAFRVQGSGPLLFDVKPVWQAKEGGQHRLGLQLLPTAAAASDNRTLKRWLDALPLELNPTRRGRRRLWFRRRLKAS